jgi:O-antigen ligase
VTAARAAAILVSLFFALPVVATWGHSAIPTSLRLLVLAVLIVAAARPVWGLLLVAGLLPLAGPIQVITAAPIGAGGAAEIIVAPLLLAAGVRLALTASEIRSRLLWPALAMASIVAASGVVQLALQPEAVVSLPRFLGSLWAHVVGDYHLFPSGFFPLHVVVPWLEGLALAVTAETILQRDPAKQLAAVRMFLIGGAALAAFSVVRATEIALARIDPVVAAWQLLTTIRVFPFFDINAGASTCVLFAVPALWVALKSRWRPRWLLAPITVLALWLAGSRAALAGAVVGLAVAAWLGSRYVSRRVVIAGAIVTLGLAWLATLNPGREQIAASVAMTVRAEMTRIGLQLAAENPLFGVGIGRFKPLSAKRISPDLVARYPALGAGENAHNNFVQILAELGVPGLLALLWLLGVVAYGALMAANARTARPELIGLAAGLLAFLVSSLSGHPLLVIPVVFVFFLAVGLTAGVTPPSERGDAAMAASFPWATGILIVFLLATLPVRLGW